MCPRKYNFWSRGWFKWRCRWQISLRAVLFCSQPKYTGRGECQSCFHMKGFAPGLALKQRWGQLGDGLLSWKNCAHCNIKRDPVFSPIPNTVTRIVLYLEFSKYFVRWKPDPQHTVRDSVASDPLACILASLRSNPLHTCQPRQFNLQPLITVPITCDPRSNPAVTTCMIEPGSLWTVIVVVWRGST